LDNGRDDICFRRGGDLKRRAGEARTIISGMGDAAFSPYLRLHCVDIFVRDQERSLRFYLDRLGFELAFDARLQSGERWVGVSPPNGDTVLTLIQPDPESADYKRIGRYTRVTFVTEDVAHTFREWTKLGVRFRYTPRLRRIKYQQGVSQNSIGAPLWGEVITHFEDIDRNSFTLLSLDEVSRAIEAQRRANAQKLEAERRIAHELEIARQVQARLFPQNFPACRSLEYAGVCMPARQVGGDYYDFLSLGPQRLALVIGDVAGKGMAAALLMANLQAQLRSHCAIPSRTCQSLLESINQLFYENTAPNDYATLFFAEYEDGPQHLRYVNCGHLCGLLVRNGDLIERLESTSTVLGLFREWDAAMGECRLSAGDILALYTDGATESFNAAGEEFGESGLLSAIVRRQRLSATEMARAILEEIQQFGAQEQHDDITLIVAKCTGA
jgi:phosphoserine phosphatase RsbU/P